MYWQTTKNLTNTGLTKAGWAWHATTYCVLKVLIYVGHISDSNYVCDVYFPNVYSADIANMFLLQEWMNSSEFTPHKGHIVNYRRGTELLGKKSSVIFGVPLYRISMEIGNPPYLKEPWFFYIPIFDTWNLVIPTIKGWWKLVIPPLTYRSPLP